MRSVFGALGFLWAFYFIPLQSFMFLSIFEQESLRRLSAATSVGSRVGLGSSTREINGFSFVISCCFHFLSGSSCYRWHRLSEWFWKELQASKVCYVKINVAEMLLCFFGFTKSVLRLLVCGRSFIGLLDSLLLWLHVQQLVLYFAGWRCHSVVIFVTVVDADFWEFQGL